MNNFENIVDEINQLRMQYLAEVGGGGRKAWPLSIKTRVFKLLSLGHKIKSVAKHTQIPHETIGYWVQYEHKKAKENRPNQLMPKNFQELTVTVNSSGISKSTNVEKVVTVTVTTPKGYLIEGLPAELAIELLRLGMGG
jgi:hypothetical protein